MIISAKSGVGKTLQDLSSENFKTVFSDEDGKNERF